MSEDKVVKQAAIIQALVEEVSVRNLDSITNLNLYCLSLTKTLQDFIEGLEEGLGQHIEDEKHDCPEIQKLYNYLGRMSRELIKTSRKTRQSISVGIIQELDPYMKHLEQRNHWVYQQLCNHYKDTAIAYKMMSFKPDIQDIYNPVLKQRDILNRTRQKYKITLAEFDRVNSDYLEYTKIHIKKGIRAINQLLNLDNVQRFLSSSQFKKTLEPQPIVNELISELQNQLGNSNLLQASKSSLGLSDSQLQIQNYVEYFFSSQSTTLKSFEQTRCAILGQQIQSVYFMNRLAQTVRTDTNLPPEKYHDIGSMIKFIFASMMELDQANSELLVYILRATLRLKSGNRWMLKQMKNYNTFWKDQGLWVNLFKEIKKSTTVVSSKNYLRKIQKIYKLRWRRLRKNSSTTVDSNQEASLEAIRQLGMYMAALELQSQFVTQVLIRLCRIQSIPRGQTERLIKYQNSSQKELLNKKYLSLGQLMAEKDILDNQSYSNKLIQAVKLSLKFLPLDQNPLALRLVSREWNKHLSKPIQQRYLQWQKCSSVVQKYRLSLYLMICKAPKLTLQEYQNIHNKVPENFAYRQIISLDVKRSLKWNLDLCPILSSVLQTFAYTHPETGYLQGMNYLVEHLLKLSHQPNQVYQIFEFVMVRFYSNNFDNNFALLRVKIYQLIRLVQIFIPELARHFQKEKIQGEYFLFPWAITLWGQFKGDMAWIMSDGFILSGWTWWLKVCFWVLREKKEQLLGRKFQDIMKFFSKQIEREVLDSNFSAGNRNIRAQISRLPITDLLLGKIEKEYINSSDKIQKLLDAHN